MRLLPEADVFTRSDARALGWSDGSISRAVRAGRITRLRHGRFTVAAGPHAALLAALDSCGGSVASHRSALEVHGLPVVGTPAPVPELTVQPRRIGSLRDAQLHRATLWPEDVTLVEDVPVTSIARTLVDIGRSRPSAAAVAAMDKALHEQWVTEDELMAVALRCWTWPGIRRALRAIRLSDWRAESPLESVSRLVLRWLDLPEPDLQPRIFDAGAPDTHGRLMGRLDFYWDDVRVFGEADGRSKYTDTEVLVAEKRREEALDDLGLVPVRWMWSDITGQPRYTKYRIEQAFERGRRRDRSGFRRTWSVVRAERGQLPRKPDR